MVDAEGSIVWRIADWRFANKGYAGWGFGELPSGEQILGVVDGGGKGLELFFELLVLDDSALVGEYLLN